MTWSVCTFLLATVALMASQTSVPAGPDSAQGRDATRTLTVKPANSPAGACFSVRRRSIATLQLRSPLFQPKWVSGIFKSMSGPVTSWLEPGALLDPRRTSDTSQKVPCNESSGYIPCINYVGYQGMYAGSVGVETAAWYARGPWFESERYAHSNFCFSVYVLGMYQVHTKYSPGTCWYILAKVFEIQVQTSMYLVWQGSALVRTML